MSITLHRFTGIKCSKYTSIIKSDLSLNLNLNIKVYVIRHVPYTITYLSSKCGEEISIESKVMAKKLKLDDFFYKGFRQLRP